MIGMFDPYRRRVIYYNHPPEDPTMQEAKDYFEPLRLQIESLQELFTEAETEYATTPFHPSKPNATWTRLAIAIMDVVATSRRMF